MFKLALKNVLRRREQSALTMLLTIISIMVFTLIFAFYIVFSQGINLAGKRLGADILILPNEALADEYMTLFTAEPNNIYMPIEVVDSINNIEGIEKISTQFFTQTLNASCCSVDSETRLIGFDMKTDFVLKPWFIESNIKELADDEIIIGSNIPVFLGNRTVILGKLFKVVGSMSPTGTGMDDTYFVNMDVAKELAANSSYMQNLWIDKKPADLCSAILIKVQNGAVIEKIVEEIEKKDLKIKIVTTGDVIVNVKKQIYMISEMMMLFWIVLFIVTGLSLIGRYNAVAQARKKEVGILRAIGGQKIDSFKLIAYEACIISSVGGVIGSILGVVFLVPLIQWLKNGFVFSTYPITLTLIAKSVLLGIILSIALGCIASFYPSYKCAKLDPQEVLSGEY